MEKRRGLIKTPRKSQKKPSGSTKKLAAFVEDFEKVGPQLEKATLTFKEAEKKLHTGRGNVISQASQIKHKLQDKGDDKQEEE